MSASPDQPDPAERRRGDLVLVGLIVVFSGLAIAQVATGSAPRPERPATPLVDLALLDPAPTRRSYRDLVQAKAEVDHFKCYLCHEREPTPQLDYDERHRIKLPEEHGDIVMAHGSHERNNHCFNCHKDTNLEAFHIRDGRDLGPDESSMLCGSCHGPTYADWEAGAHGRISGHWDRSRGPIHRLDCVNCHNPHAPRIPSRVPAPAPRPLRPAPAAHP